MRLGFAVLDADLRFVFIGGNMEAMDHGIGQLIGLQPWDAFTDEKEKAKVRADAEEILEPGHAPTTSSVVWGPPGAATEWYYIIQKVWTGMPGAEIMSQYWEFPAGLLELSKTERKVLETLGEVGSARLVADRLHRSLSTINTHLRKIRNKLGLPSLAAVEILASQYYAGLRDSQATRSFGGQA